MPHVDEGTLHALLDGALRAESPDEADRVEAHLRACEDCRARYRSAAEIRDSATAILGATQVDVEPDFEDVLRRAEDPGAAVAPPAAGPRLALARQARWTRRVAWAASIVVALGTGYLVGDRLGGLPDTAGRDEAARSEAAGESRDGPPDPAAPPAVQSGAPERGAADAREGGQPQANRPASPEESRVDRLAAPATEAEAAAEPSAEAPAVMAAAEGPPVDGEPAGEEDRDVAAAPVGEPPTGEERVARADSVAELAEAGLAANAAPVPAEQTMKTETEPRPDEVARNARRFQPAAQPTADAANRLGQDAWAADVTLEEMVVTAATVADTIWRRVDRAVADSLYLLPRAEPQEAFVSADSGSVLTVQRLSSGVVVRVTQRRPDSAGEAVPTGAEAEGGARPALRDEAAEAEGQPPVARATVGGFVLEVTGPLPTELLEILAGEAAPLRP
jgi:hypothetical protein